MSPKKPKTVPTRPREAASKSTVNDVQVALRTAMGRLADAAIALTDVIKALDEANAQLQRSQRR